MPKNADDTTIDIPPAEDATITGETFTFDVSSDCTVCFGTADPAGTFPELEDQTFEWTAGSTHQYPVPSTEGADLPYNTSDPGTPCSAVGPSDIGRTIHTGSGIEATQRTAKSKPAGKAKGKPRTAAKLVSKAKPPSKTKAKATPKAKPPAKAKAKPLAKAKPKAKAKPPAKAKPKTKAKAKKGAKWRR
jgi:hypothetical protein